MSFWKMNINSSLTLLCHGPKDKCKVMRVFKQGIVNGFFNTVKITQAEKNIQQNYCT